MGRRSDPAQHGGRKGLRECLEASFQCLRQRGECERSCRLAKASRKDLGPQGFRLRVRLLAQLLGKEGTQVIILAEGKPAPTGRRENVHQTAVPALFQRVEVHGCAGPCSRAVQVMVLAAEGDQFLQRCGALLAETLLQAGLPMLECRAVLQVEAG